MPIEKEEADKKNDDNKPGPVAETILEGASNKGDNTVEAEMNIRSFVGRRLEEFHNQVQGAIDKLEIWILSQSDESRQSFDTYGFFGFLGDAFIRELHLLAGGKGAPLMDVIAREVYNTTSWAQHAEHDVGGFIYHMRRSIRDASWFVRDNVGAVLSNQWPQLLKLGAEGSYDFVGPLLQLGLPSVNFNPAEFGDRLVADVKAHRDVHAPAREQVEQSQQQKAPEQQQQQQDAAKDEQKAIQQDETKRQKVA